MAYKVIPVNGSAFSAQEIELFPSGAIRARQGDLNRFFSPAGWLEYEAAVDDDYEIESSIG